MKKEINELEKLLKEAMARVKQLKYSYYGGGGFDPYLYAIDQSSNIRKYTLDGVEITDGFPITPGGTINSITVDFDGNLYACGTVNNSKTTYKWSKLGVLKWSVNHGGTVNDIAVDDDGNVYTVGNRTNSVVVRKYDSNGNQLWTGDLNIFVNGAFRNNDGLCICLDSTKVYIGVKNGYLAGFIGVYLKSNGSFSYLSPVVLGNSNTNYPSSPGVISYDSVNDCLYLTGDSAVATFNQVSKINKSNGSVFWVRTAGNGTTAPGTQVFANILDGVGNIFTGQLGGTGIQELKKWDSNGNIIGSTYSTVVVNVSGISLDKDDNIYIITRTSSNRFEKLDSNFNIIWSKSMNTSSTSYGKKLAIYPLPNSYLI